MSDPTTSPERVSTVVVVPGEQAMVSLLGSRDELLRVIERSLDSDVHVRGNEITITGRPADNAIAVRLFEELLELIKAGQNLTPDAVSRALGILTADAGERASAPAGRESRWRKARGPTHDADSTTRRERPTRRVAAGADEDHG